MAYLLRFDGSNDYVELASTVNISSSDDFSLKWRWPTRVAGNHRVLGGNGFGSTSSRIIHFSNGNIILYGGSGGNISFSQSTDQSVDREIELRRVSGNLSLHYDGAQQGPSQSSSQSFTFGILGENFGTATVESDLYSFVFEVNGVVVSSYDPSASNGTGQTLPDTVGSNNGTLVNFPTDNSQWIFYDDGGGAVTADAAYTINAPTFTSSASVTLPSPIADASFSLPSPTFAASADASLPQPVADAAFTLNAPTFSATATATIPGFSASVAYSINKPTFSADASVTLPNPTTDVAYTVTAPTFSANGTVTLPQPTADAAFSLPTPTFAASATATEPGFNASVNFALPAPTFSATATATLPQPIADGNFSITAPTFSVVAIVGGIAIIVDNETNINMPALSTNINAPVLSNNVRI